MNNDLATLLMLQIGMWYLMQLTLREQEQNHPSQYFNVVLLTSVGFAYKFWKGAKNHKMSNLRKNIGSLIYGEKK